MTAPLSEDCLVQVGNYLAGRIGLHFPAARWRDLQRGIEYAAPEFGFKNANDCARWIAGSDLSREQIDTLAAYLTISETFFFREAALFRHLETILLPELIEKRRAGDMRLRFWCAGCCTGEEVYSLAIVLHRLIPDLPRWNISLLGTDINVRSLAKARAASYGPWSFRGNESWNDTRFFTPGPGKDYTVRPELRSFVRFEYLNLAENSYPSFLNNTSEIDVLFCRNVLMYFEPGAALDAFGKLAAALAEDGWLIVAPSELSLVRNDLLASVHFDTTILHRKAAPRAVVPAPPEIAPAAPPRTETPPAAPAPPAVSRPRVLVPAEETHDAAADLERAQSLCARHQYAAAHELAGQVAAAYPRDAKAMRLLARICANEGRLEEAMAWCEKAIAADRVNPSGYYLRALVMQEQGFHGEAGEALRQTLYLDPDFIIAHFTLGALARAIGDAPASRRHWRNTAQLLARCGPGEILPESEGLSAARLKEIVDDLIELEAAT